MHNTIHTASTPRPAVTFQRGFSVIELMIALVLVGILLGGLMQLFLSSKQNFAAAGNLSRLQETGRSALQLLSEDIRRSGYLGGNSDITTIFGSLGMSGNASNCIAGDTSWGRMMGQFLHGLDDTNTGYACITDANYLRGDILTTRYASPWTVADGDMVSSALYLRSTLFEGKIFAGTDNTAPANTVSDISSENFELEIGRASCRERV